MQVCDENHIDLYDGLILRVSAGPHLKSVAVADQTAVSARTGVRHRNPKDRCLSPISAQTEPAPLDGEWIPFAGESALGRFEQAQDLIA
jgi:hypothetical protein